MIELGYISAAEVAVHVMIESATGLSQKLNSELSWADREAERCRVSETEANWKKLRRSSTSYENAKLDCLATKAGNKKEVEEIQRLT